MMNSLALLALLILNPSSRTPLVNVILLIRSRAQSVLKIQVSVQCSLAISSWVKRTTDLLINWGRHQALLSSILLSQLIYAALRITSQGVML